MAIEVWTEDARYPRAPYTVHVLFENEVPAEDDVYLKGYVEGWGWIDQGSFKSSSQNRKEVVVTNEDGMELLQASVDCWMHGGAHDQTVLFGTRGGITNDYGYNTNKSVLEIKIGRAQPLTSPTNLHTSNVTSTSAQLHWNSVENADGYKIEYRPSGASNWSQETVSPN